MARSTGNADWQGARTLLRAPWFLKMAGVSDSVDIEAARIPDRDRLLQELQEAGLDARPVGEVEIEVRAEEGEVYEQVEGMIMSLGAPFVPIKHEGVIYVRPPVG